MRYEHVIVIRRSNSISLGHKLVSGVSATQHKAIQGQTFEPSNHTSLS